MGEFTADQPKGMEATPAAIPADESTEDALQAEAGAYDPEQEESTSDPYEQVEDLLAENAEVFATVESSWRKVRELQHGAIDEADPAMAAQLRPVKSRRPTVLGQNVGVNSRSSQRGGGAIAKQLGRQNAAVARAKASAQVRRWARETSDWSDEAIAALSEQYDAAEGRDLDRHGSVHEVRVSNQTRRSADQTNTFGKAYVQAYASQTRAINVIMEALKDDAIVVPLVQRLTEMARDGQSGPREFPGLMESLAVHVDQEKGRGIIMEALTRVLGDSLNTEFIQLMLGSESERQRLNLSAELIGFVAGIQLTAEMIRREAGTPLENLAGLLMQYPDLWPQQLIESFGPYTENHVVSQKKTLHSLLEAYLQRGESDITRQLKNRKYEVYIIGF